MPADTSPRAARLQRTLTLLRLHGYRNVAEVAVGRQLNRVFARPLRKRVMPSLHELNQSATHTFRDAGSVIGALGEGRAQTDDEAAAAVIEEARRWAVEHAAFPSVWGVEAETARFLYDFVRAVRPDRVLETGVANGTSSYVILSAMHANGHGQLVSTDIEAAAHHQLPAHLAQRWTFVHLQAQPPEAEMPAVFESHGPFDVYFHDADHSYLGQRFEYLHAWECLTDGGWFLSDDIDFSTAWIEFVAEKSLDSIHLVDGRKVLGIARKGARLSFDDTRSPSR